jgi:hypothetical protein
MNQGSALAVSQKTLIPTFPDKFHIATQLYSATQTPLAKYRRHIINCSIPSYPSALSIVKIVFRTYV